MLMNVKACNRTFGKFLHQVCHFLNRDSYDKVVLDQCDAVTNLEADDERPPDLHCSLTMAMW